MLLNEWTRSLPNSALGTLPDYRQSFLKWLSLNQHWFAESRENDECVEQLTAVFSSIRKGMLNAMELNDLRTPENRALDALRSWVQGITTFETFANTDDTWLDSTEALLRNQIDERIEYWFDDVPRSEEIDRCFRAYSREFLRHGMFEQRAKLAFVGYGADGVLPGYATTEMVGILNKRLLHLPSEPFVGDAEMNPFFGILPLGLVSAINLFLRGFEPRSIDLAVGAAVGTLRRVRSDLSGVVPDDVMDSESFDSVFDRAEDQTSEAISEALWNDSDEKYVNPLSYAISALPPATLAAVARSLVELQALRQTTTAEQSTVGGPIDVATITRHGGFEWVRHKSVS